MSQFTDFMPDALIEARAAAARGEVPVGAVVVKDGQVIARAGNRMRALRDPTAHAEMLAIRAACAALKTERLAGCALWVTLEPCPACAGAIAAARLEKLYYAASDPKSGGVAQGPRVFDHPQAHHRPDIYAGLHEAEAAGLLKAFFNARR
ncbi:nucleoside deaminase [Gymnodinialimonas ulvae]|uniref:nucleoside deaminase n=1 Tax=Gymnodinialimonas ulvae TaxID=3126504 RepID=UPI0030A19FA0